jgi:hypothetical protein
VLTNLPRNTLGRVAVANLLGSATPGVMNEHPPRPFVKLDTNPHA